MKTPINNQKDIIIPDWLDKEMKGNRLLARILLQRGINTPEKVKQFLDPQYYQATDPFAFPKIEEAVDKILSVIENKKKICIYGDYDVDGVTSTVILLDMIKKLNGQAIYHLPDRFKEGYGMNSAVVRSLADEVDLIITCDCGISNYDEIELAKEHGLEVIITDHHQLPNKLPPADFILSPKLLAEDHQAFNIPGAGMAYFLALAILKRLGREDESNDFLDLLSLAIVADVVPLLEENRYLLQIGLPALASTKRPGLIELFKVAGIINLENITEEDIAFRVAPMINSAGRILKAELAVELLLANEEFEARKKAVELEVVNKRRKKLQDTVIEEALEMLGENHGRKSIVLYRPHWNEGVIGIAAGRLCEDYQVPVLLMCQKDDGQTVTGSARSVPDIHVFEQIKKCERYLTKYGGHAGAAGFSLQRDNLTGFSKGISSVLSEEIEQDFDRTIDVDGELCLAELTKQDYHNLRQLAPFGEQNPKPKFITYDTEVIYSRATTGDRHLRLILAQNGVQHSAIWWWAGDKKLDNKVDLIYSLDINDFQGKRELQLVVDDILIENKQTEDVVRESKSLDFELIDYRNWKDKNQELPVFSDAAYYYEGLNKIKDKEIINRYQLTDKKTLVLLSCPPSLEIFKELIYANRPIKLVLAFSKGDIADHSTFLQQLTGLLKFIISKKGGQLDVYQLSTLTGQLESTIVAGLQYLEARGYISLNSFNPRYFIVRYGEGKKINNSKLYLQELMSLINESKSFYKYMIENKFNNINDLCL